MIRSLGAAVSPGFASRLSGSMPLPVGGDHLVADARHRARRLAALLFGAGLAVLAPLYADQFLARDPVLGGLQSPLGATFGEGLLASAVIAVFIVMCVLALPQRAGRHPGEAEV